MQHFKHFVETLATPLMLALVMGAVGILCRARKRRRIAAWLLAGAAAIVYLGSLDVVGEALLAPLESQYPPLREDAQLQDVGYVVVLGSGFFPRDGVPVTAALDPDGLTRIVEGLRLARHMGAVRLVVSGGAAQGFTPVARGYAELARDFGVPDASLVVLDRSLDTGDEARTVKAQLGAAPFLMVTSAYHMPRAVRLMRHVGAHPIPAPTGQRVGEYKGGWLQPTSTGMRSTELALHEYLGLAALAFGIS
jgi:uncharacterized SAM-binding protein YcdF (DUF218 family)